MQGKVTVRNEAAETYNGKLRLWLFKLADNGYYFVDAKVQYTAKAGNVITGIESVQARQVAGVKYYNVAGVESDRPFKGVNIVVTRYSDGSMSTTKIVK